MNPQKQRELNDNLDFMRGQFDALNAQIKLPHSLDADMMRYKLEHIELQDEKRADRNPWFKPIIGVAACFVVVFGSIFALRGTNGLDSTLPAPAAAPQTASAVDATAAPAALPQMAAFSGDSTADGTQAAYADSYTALRDTVYQMNGGADYYSAVPEDGAASDATAAGSPDMLYGSPAPANEMPMTAEAAPVPSAAKMMPRNTGAAGFSATNTQEIGVDEADIVKTDGRYLFSYVAQNTTSQSPAIFITDAQTMQISAKIELEQEQISEFYVAEDRLVTVGSSYDDLLYRELQMNKTIVEATDDSILRATETPAAREKRIEGGHESMAVQARIYDITDRTAPKQIKSFAQDGDYTTSRVANDVLYLVSSRYVSPALNRKETPLSELVPAVYDGATARVLPASSIAIAPQGNSPCYAVVSTLDIKSGVSDTQAVLGGSDGVYMSPDSLYVYYGSYRDHATTEESLYRSSIVRFDAGKKLTLGKTGVVDGYIDGQFSLSEKDGNLRVATTADGISGVTSSRVTVLDRDMQQIGLLKDIAPDERIYAARYVGDMAYLVTFRQTDPLFAIDLSDPKNPRLLGQLKIPGFSEYLHPIDDKTLLGIGQATNADGTVTGMKLSLFDVSVPTQPKELNVYNLGGQGSWSEALDNHKAVMFNPARSMFAFPAQVEKAGGISEPAYFVFTYDKVKGFTLAQAITHTPTDAYSAFNDVRRGLYIGDTLYTFSDEKVVSFNLDTFAQEKELLLK